ncbi:uncharacterized protein LOC130451094 [Diorhabda sublineata]|uniref:uncharacterized protein LOC130451094 n=1 Tax=Diorhabda sublineata TaxID=1163346 RepID=UPI0024E18E20|nr:uncharacterized protein LOC130451094 [Diorhabda sublineata]
MSVNMKLIITTLAVFFIAYVSSFGGNDEKFLKKYAMMKIYESCFGEQVVKQIRQELKKACAKCSSFEETPFIPNPIPPTPELKPQTPQEVPGYNSAFPQSSIEAEKLHQAILAFRPNPLPQQSFKQQYPGFNPANFYGSPLANPVQLPFFYPGYPQVPFSPYNFPSAGQAFYGTRMARNMDLKNQLELLTTRISGRVRNITCVMQELGYLDENLEPNYNRINERIGNLPITEELKKDMQDGVTFCQQFSQCVPEVKKERSPLSRELIRPMFFFKCYKHKKLEACIMKDVREKFAGVSDEELDGDLDLRRAGKDIKISKAEQENNVNDLESSMYDFLYSSDSNIDMDGFL